MKHGEQPSSTIGQGDPQLEAAIAVLKTGNTPVDQLRNVELQPGLTGGHVDFIFSLENSTTSKEFQDHR